MASRRPGRPSRWPFGWVDTKVLTINSQGLCKMLFSGAGAFRPGSKVTVIPRSDADTVRDVLWAEFEPLDPAAGEG